MLLQVLNGAGILDQLVLTKGGLQDSQAKGHARVGVDTGGNGDGRVTGLGGDLDALGNIRRDKETVQLLALVGESIVDTVSGGGLAELEGLPVGLVLDTLGLERSEETVLAGPESRSTVGHGVATLGSGVLVVVFDNVLERADLGVVELGKVSLDVVVEIDLDVGVLGLVGETAGSAVVPVPAVGADEGLVVGDLGVVDDGGAGRLDEGQDAGQDLLLLRIGVDPEAVPGDTESGTLEGSAVGQELGISALGGQALLSQGVVVSGVNAVNSIEGVGSIANSAAKGTDGILVLGFGNDTGAGCQTNGGLDADNGVTLSRVDDCCTSVSTQNTQRKKLISHSATIYSPLPSVSVPRAKAMTLAPTPTPLPELLPPGLTVKL